MIPCFKNQTFSTFLFHDKNLHLNSVLQMTLTSFSRPFQEEKKSNFKLLQFNYTSLLLHLNRKEQQNLEFINVPCLILYAWGGIYCAMFNAGFQRKGKKYNNHNLIPKFNFQFWERPESFSAEFCRYYPFNGSNESEQSHQKTNNAKSPKHDPLSCPCFNIAQTQVHFHWKIYR